MRLSLLWVSNFVLGVCVLTPFSSYNLCIDYYEAAFPGAQLAVKATVCYQLAFVTLQVICHLADARLPISRAARIELRHVVVALLMLFIVVWERVMVGPDLHHPNASSLPIFLTTVAFVGVMDGISVGAVYGQAAVLGPASAHALVAGTAGVMPLLAVMRIMFKAALPATTHGIRLSVVLYFAAAAAVLLAGLALHRLVVLPAVAAAACCTYSGSAKQYKDKLGVLPHAPVLGVTVHDDDDDDTNSNRDEESGRKKSSQSTRHGTLGMVPKWYPCAAAASHTEHRRNAANPFPAAAAPEWAISPFAAAPPAQQQQHQSTSPFAAVDAENAEAPYQQQQQQQELGQPMRSGQHSNVPSPFDLTMKLHALQQEPGNRDAGAAAAAAAPAASAADDYGGDDHGSSDEGVNSSCQWSSRESVTSGSQAGASSRWSTPRSNSSMQCAMSMESQPKNPSCLWAVDSMPFATPGSSVGGFPSDVDVVLDPKEMRLSNTFSDVLNIAAMKPGVLRAATAAGVVEPVLKEMLPRVAAAAPEEPKYFGEGINIWRSNWLTIKDNKWYMLGTVLTYTCNYGIFPAFVAFTVQSPALGSWYSLLLVTTYGVGDLLGKLLPIWKPRKPQATIMGMACARLVIFLMVFVVALLLGAPPVVFFFAIFLLTLSSWYEAMIFSLACDGHHPQDAHQIESLLAIHLFVGIALGSVLSLAWAAGPWAAGVQATGVAHG